MQLDGVGEVSCLYQVLFGVPELFCKRGSSSWGQGCVRASLYMGQDCTEHALEFVGLSHMGSSGDTLRASLSGIFLQTLPEYVAPVKGHSLSLTISEILKCLSSLPALMQKSFWRRQCNDRYIISLSPNLHSPFSPSPTFSPSLISLTVSVDVKHNVYLLQVHLHTPSPLLLPVPNKPYGFCGR